MMAYIDSFSEFSWANMTLSALARRPRKFFLPVSPEVHSPLFFLALLQTRIQHRGYRQDESSQAP